MILVDLVAFILVIGIIILVHEAGHFFTAIKSGVKCNEFSIGMGPIIKQWKKGETTISLRWIPLGGYVSMVDGNESDLYIDLNKELGLNLDENGNVTEIICVSKIDCDVKGICKRKELKSIHGEPLEIDLEIDGELKTYPVLDNACYVIGPSDKQEIVPYEKSFDSKKIWKRLVILAAGACMNFILGLVLCVIAAFIQGVPNYDSNIVGSIDEVYPAYQVGLRENDTITGFNAYIDGENVTYEVNSWSEVSSQLNKIYQKDKYPTIEINYTRDGKAYTTDSFNPYVYIYNVGITNEGSEIYQIPTSETGVIVGTVGVNYESDSGEEISKYDLITAMQVNVWNGSKYVESEFVEVTSWSKIIETFSSLDSARVKFKFKKHIIDGDNITFGEESTTKSITLYSEEVLKAQNVNKIAYFMGISPTYHKEFSGCMANAFKQCGAYFSLVIRTLKVLIAPSNGARTVGLKNMSSVVGIFDMVAQYLSTGPATFLFFVAMLSINIGLMNLLPIPALDGGRIVFVLYEAITGKKPNKKVESIITLIVYALLMILFVYVTVNDIKRLFK